MVAPKIGNIPKITAYDTKKDPIAKPIDINYYTIDDPAQCHILNTLKRKLGEDFPDIREEKSSEPPINEDEWDKSYHLMSKETLAK
jgi:hypothetical protein